MTTNWQQMCSVKNFDCCSNDCDNCQEKEFANEIIEVLDAVDNITYSK